MTTIRRHDMVLRPLTRDDVPRVTELIGDWEVARWLAAPPHPYASGDAVEFITTVALAPQSEGCCISAITLAGQLAGIIGIEEGRTGRILGYWLGRPYWGCGIMTAAATMLTRDFFAKSSFDVLTSGYFSGNERSWAIQQRLGFQVVGEGTLFNRPHGKHLPHVDTALTRARWATLGV